MAYIGYEPYNVFRCQHKRAFDSVEAAQMSAVMRAYGPEWSVYECPVCDRFHLTRRGKKVEDACPSS